jgi:hypothetical protein
MNPHWGAHCSVIDSMPYTLAGRLRHFLPEDLIRASPIRSPAMTGYSTNSAGLRVQNQNKTLAACLSGFRIGHFGRVVRNALAGFAHFVPR